MLYYDSCVFYRPSMPQYIEEIGNSDAFGEELKTNPGVIIVKFGAEWCGPCKKIEGLVQTRMTALPNNFKCFIIDIDEHFELYAFLKTKRMVNGIPAILAWKRGNLSVIPDAIVNTSNVAEVETFFQQCLQLASA